MKFFACIIGISIILIASTAARVFEDKYGRIINQRIKTREDIIQAAKQKYMFTRLP